MKKEEEIIKAQDARIALMERVLQKQSMLLKEKGISPNPKEVEEDIYLREVIRLTKM